MKNYDPSLVQFVHGTHRVQGFAKGTMIKVERNSESFKTEVGAQGDVVRVRMRDKTGKVTVTLQAESSSNDYFSTTLRADELFGTQVKPCFLKNINGTTSIHAEESWVEKPADAAYGDDAETREWVIQCADVDAFIGGALS